MLLGGIEEDEMMQFIETHLGFVQTLANVVSVAIETKNLAKELIKKKLDENDMKIYRALANAGITEALVKIIHEHREFVKVQEKACTIVAQITANLTAETYVFVENGGVSRLVDVMCYYQESLVIQESGCNILRTLAKLSTKNRQRIVQSGGIDVIYAAIDTFQELSSSHESTATLLLTALD